MKRLFTSRAVRLQVLVTATVLIGALIVARMAGSLPRIVYDLLILMVLLSTSHAFLWITLRDRRRVVTHVVSGLTRSEGHPEWLKERRELQTRIDFLSAEREISLILNHDVEFRTIQEKVLAITADLLGARDLGIIEIYLRDPSTGQLVLKAVRHNGKTMFEDDLEKKQYPSNSGNDLSLGDTRVIYVSEHNHVTMAVQLASDQEWMGVMKVRIPLEGDVGEKEERIQLLSHHLDEFAKFISLALKTPDLYTRAIEDSLTGLATKRHFFHQLQKALDTARRYHEPLALIIMDIDHFKSINDTHGHVTGDQVLKEVAEVIRRGIRRADAAYSGYRYGGEELIIILPRTDVAHAVIVAERLRQMVEKKKLATEKRERIPVTISLGVAGLDSEMQTMEDFIGCADQALYRAKRTGRNRVCTFVREALREETR